MSVNGRLPDSALSSIPFGRLRKDAAMAWNAGPARAGLRPLGPNSSYRTYAMQVYYWNLYISGRGNLAARPGTSNHGWAIAVDLFARWMRDWIDRHGAAYGWRKVEAPSEWWHVNYVGGFKPKPDPTNGLGRRRKAAARLLLYRRGERAREGKTGHGPRWRRWDRAVGRSYHKVEELWRRCDDRKQKAILRRVLDDRDGNL